MFDKLASLFSENKAQNLAEVLGAITNFIKFIEQKSGNDIPKFNEIIDQIKELFEQHKK